MKHKALTLTSGLALSFVHPPSDIRGIAPFWSVWLRNIYFQEEYQNISTQPIYGIFPKKSLLAN